MKRKTLLIIGIILVSGAVVAASALSQTSESGMVAGSNEHECPIEMMENMESDSELESKTDYSMEDCEPEMMGTDMMSESDHCDDMDSIMEEREINQKTRSF